MSPGGEFYDGVFRSSVAGVVPLATFSVIAAASDRGAGSSGAKGGPVFRQPAVIRSLDRDCRSQQAQRRLNASKIEDRGGFHG